MSAVPDNILDFGTWDTLGTDLPTYPLSNGSPSNVVDVPRSSGISWDGILSGVNATADSLLNTFGKVYQIQSSVENAKFQRVVNEANQSLKMAQTMGTIDIQRASIDANVAIEKARASRATNDAIAQVNSGAAGYVVQTGKISPMLIIGGALIVGAALFFRKGK
jgi:hypothetical protein